MDQGRDHDGFYAAKLATAHFYAEHTLPHAAALERTIIHGSAAVMGVDEAIL